MYSAFNLILYLSGNLDNLIDKLHNAVNGVAKVFAPSLRNLPAKLSIPTALFGFISSKAFDFVTRNLMKLKKIAIQIKVFVVPFHFILFRT